MIVTWVWAPFRHKSVPKPTPPLFQKSRHVVAPLVGKEVWGTSSQARECQVALTTTKLTGKSNALEYKNVLKGMLYVLSKGTSC